MAGEKHTPGPWRTTQTWSSLQFSGEYGVEAPTPEGPGHPTPNATGFYAMALPPPHGRDPESRATQKANAHLIAAAPDLLAALKSVISSRGGVMALGKSDARTVAVLAAIAKAEGGEA